MSKQRDEIRDWLRRSLAERGRGAKKALADYLGIRADAITRMLNDDPSKETREITAAEMVRMRQFFGADESSEYRSEVRPTIPNLVTAMVVGTVEAGAFREVSEFDDVERVVIWLPADERFPDARMMAFDVAGDSMNLLRPRPILPGDRIACVAFEDVADQLPLRDGMTVVVERRRDGGHIREWSVKQLEIYENRVEFHPRSSNPKHKSIVVRRDTFADDGTEVEIIAVVRQILNSVPLD